MTVSETSTLGLKVKSKAEFALRQLRHSCLLSRGTQASSMGTRIVGPMMEFFNTQARGKLGICSSSEETKLFGDAEDCANLPHSSHHMIVRARFLPFNLKHARHPENVRSRCHDEARFGRVRHCRR
jgi:hypothetical protein